MALPRASNSMVQNRMFLQPLYLQEAQVSASIPLPVLAPGRTKLPVVAVRVASSMWKYRKRSPLGLVPQQPKPSIMTVTSTTLPVRGWTAATRGSSSKMVKNTTRNNNSYHIAKNRWGFTQVLPVFQLREMDGYRTAISACLDMNEMTKEICSCFL